MTMWSAARGYTHVARGTWHAARGTWHVASAARRTSLTSHMALLGT